MVAEKLKVVDLRGLHYDTVEGESGLNVREARRNATVLPAM